MVIPTIISNSVYETAFLVTLSLVTYEQNIWQDTAISKKPFSLSTIVYEFFDMITSFLSGYIVGVGRVHTVTRAP